MVGRAVSPRLVSQNALVLHSELFHHLRDDLLDDEGHKPDLEKYAPHFNLILPPMLRIS